MVPVVEMFCSIQGEGMYAGTPSFFVRTSGCNLRCVFKDSTCDTPYTSFCPEKSKWKTMDELVDAFMQMRKENPNVSHLVITGGEPMLHKEGLKEFIERVQQESGQLGMDELVVTIESNGTLGAIDDYVNPYLCDDEIDLYSISPKLSTSVDKNLKHLTKEQAEHHDKTRINIEQLYQVYKTKHFQFKFVYSGPECIDEIKDIYNRMWELHNEKCKHTHGEDTYDEQWEHCYKTMFYSDLNAHTMLMPEGITNAQLETKRKECVEACIREGWKYAERIHIIIWGDKRGV